jgi:hypothetical protein
LGQWFGDVHEFGLWCPDPLADRDRIWLVAPPVWVATHSHGCGVLHSAGAEVPQASEPLFRP